MFVGKYFHILVSVNVRDSGRWISDEPVFENYFVSLPFLQFAAEQLYLVTLVDPSTCWDAYGKERRFVRSQLQDIGLKLLVCGKGGKVVCSMHRKEVYHLIVLELSRNMYASTADFF